IWINWTCGHSGSRLDWQMTPNHRASLCGRLEKHRIETHGLCEGQYTHRESYFAAGKVPFRIPGEWEYLFTDVPSIRILTATAVLKDCGCTSIHTQSVIPNHEFAHWFKFHAVSLCTLNLFF